MITFNIYYLTAFTVYYNKSMQLHLAKPSSQMLQFLWQMISQRQNALTCQFLDEIIIPQNSKVLNGQPCAYLPSDIHNSLLYAAQVIQQCLDGPATRDTDVTTCSPVHCKTSLEDVVCPGQYKCHTTVPCVCPLPKNSSSKAYVVIMGVRAVRDSL